MKKIMAFLAILPALSAPSHAVTVTTAANAFMVENTSGTDRSGNVCYDFITTPTCSAKITNISSSSISGLLNSSNTWTGINTWNNLSNFNGQVTFSSDVVAGTSQGTAGQALQSNAGSAPSWVNVPSAILSTTSTWSAQQTFASTAAFNAPISLNGSFGTAGQVLSTNVGSAPSWMSVATTNSTNTWTAANTFTGPVTLSSSTLISSATIINETVNVSTISVLTSPKINGVSSLQFANGAILVSSPAVSHLVQTPAFFTQTAASTTVAAAFIPTNLSGSFSALAAGDTIYIMACATAVNTTAPQSNCVYSFSVNGTEVSGQALGLMVTNTPSTGNVVTSTRSPMCMTYPYAPNTTASRTYRVVINSPSGAACGIGTGLDLQILALFDLQ